MNLIVRAMDVTNQYKFTGGRKSFFRAGHRPPTGDPLTLCSSHSSGLAELRSAEVKADTRKERVGA
jgi:hypothetical protein